MDSILAFPTNPVISGHDRLKLGEEATLTCEVSSIHPSEFLEVEWLYGDKVVYSDEGEPDRDAFSFSYTFTPSSEDDGKAITCRVSLNVDGIPSEEMTRETSVHMNVLCKLHLHLLSYF